MAGICTARSLGGHDTFVHPTGVMVDRGGDTVTITAAGVAQEALPVTQARGALIDLRFGCECGHAFTLRLRFHKGATMVSVEDTDTFDPAEGPSTLWRD